MKKILLAVILLAGMATVKAQTAEDAVKLTVNNLFVAMKSSDTELLRSCFADSAIMQTIARDKLGNTVVKSEDLASFVSFVGTLPKGAADERIVFDAIKIDGPLATVWTPYQFYMNGKFSHCGANSFNLIRTNSGWKIQYIIDTRRKDCSL